MTRSRPLCPAASARRLPAASAAAVAATWARKLRRLVRVAARAAILRSLPSSALSAGRSLLLRPGPAQHVWNRVIPLVACVLEHAPIELRQRCRGGPGLHERLRSGDGEPVINRVRIDAREALDERHVGRSKGGVVSLSQWFAVREPHEVGGELLYLVVEISGLDDQRLAFPAAARVPQPLFETGSEMRASVERNDAGVVNHLD